MKPLKLPARAGQRGLSMLFSLMALVVLSLAAIALVRSVDTSTLALGNLGFKRDASAVATRAADQAISGFLLTHLADETLYTNQEAEGYYATTLDNFDPTGAVTTKDNPRAVADWTGDTKCSYLPEESFSACLPTKDANADGKLGERKVRYLITRLCPLPGPVGGGNLCLKPVPIEVSESAQRGGMGYSNNERFGTPINAPYYRVIVRSEGARGTVSVTETIVFFQ